MLPDFSLVTRKVTKGFKPLKGFKQFFKICRKKDLQNKIMCGHISKLVSYY